MQPIFEEAKKLLSEGEPFVLATVVRTKGSTPQKPGAKLLVRKDGTGVGHMSSSARRTYTGASSSVRSAGSVRTRAMRKAPASTYTPSGAV